MHSLTRFIHLHSHPSMHRCANVKHTRQSRKNFCIEICLKSLTRGQTLTQMHSDFPWSIGLEFRSGSEQGANSYYGGYQTEFLVAAVRRGGLVSSLRARARCLQWKAPLWVDGRLGLALKTPFAHNVGWSR